MTRRIITEDAWDSEFRVLNQTILATDSPIIRAVDPHHIWTECDDGEGGTVTQSGLHIVNRIGYWLCEVPWSDEVQVNRPDEEE